MIPNLIHFIFGVTDDTAGREFTFVHYLAVTTASAAHRPEHIFLHYQYEPFGPWWIKARPYLTLNQVHAPDHVFGNRIDHPAHKSDVIRLEQLHTHGGIYLDLDVISVCDLAPLREHAGVVLGQEFKNGLCNAVILATPGARFIERWRDEYRDFRSSEWAEHSIKRPWRLAQRHSDEVTVVDQDMFYFPMYNDPPHILWMGRSQAFQRPVLRAQLLARLRKHVSRAVRLKPLKTFNPSLQRLLRSEKRHYQQLKQSHCIHLWNQLWWEPYLRHVDPPMILYGQNNFARIIRYALRDTGVVDDLAGMRGAH